MPTKHVSDVARVALEVLGSEGLHPRWARKALALLIQAVDRNPESVDPAELLGLAKNLERPEQHVLFGLIFVPILLADPQAVTVELMEQAEGVLGSHYEMRYLLAALAGHQRASAELRNYAAESSARHFPLADRIGAMLRRAPLHILCIQNIADGQGDEIIRVVPFLQAMLDAYPAARAVVLTERGYLYRHSRVTAISFDETNHIQAVLRDRIDVLLEFVDHEQPHLSYDPLLSPVIDGLRANQRIMLDVTQGKRWNEFTFNHVRVDGMDWASALSVDRPSEPNVYDPVVRLMTELGLPLRVGEQPPVGEWMLAGQESPDVAAEWERLTASREGRRTALLNPFGGNAQLKGFTPGTFPDLARLIQGLVNEGFDVLVCPSGQQWGTRETCQDVQRLLADETVPHVTVVDDHVEPSAFIQRLLSFITRADLIVTVEGWMMHAAYLAGRPYRLLTLPASDPLTWQPWGRSANQRIWGVTGTHHAGQSPLPEQPRKRAWIEMLRRLDDRRWGPALAWIASSDDPDLRRHAIDAMARSGTSDSRQLAIWLDDSSRRVRASAATALLNHHREVLGKPPTPDAVWLDVVRGVGGERPNWEQIITMGIAALPALSSLLHVDDPVTRRETAACIETIRRNALPPDSTSVTGEITPASIETSAARERTG